jgi:RNA polymerase sigma factor (TIGR02999 family)
MTQNMTQTEFSDGDQSRIKREFIERLYPQLKTIARQRLARHRTLTLLDVTALVNEALAKILGTDMQLTDQQHFMAYMANVMRSVVVDYEREQGTQKRDGGERLSLTDVDLPVADRKVDILKLDQALERLGTFEPDLVSLVEMRCFAGLQVEEIAQELGLSERTVKRNWQRARAFLKQFLGD